MILLLIPVSLQQVIAVRNDNCSLYADIESTRIARRREEQHMSEPISIHVCDVRVVKARRDGHDVAGPLPQPQTITPTGLQMLFTNDWHPIMPANLFSMQRIYKPMKSARWQNTQKAIAHDLAQWWRFVLVNNLEWDAISAEDVSEYGYLMAESVSPFTHRQYSTSTVSRRLASIQNFYSWAWQTGMLSENPQEGCQDSISRFPIGPKSALLPHLGTASIVQRKRRGPRGRDPEDNPRPLKVNELRGVLNRLGPRIFSSDGAVLPWNVGDPSKRNRLMAEIAYHTGMRVDEIASISTSDVLNQARKLSSTDKWQQFVLTVRTKGRATRKVVVSSVVLRALVTYHDTERYEAILCAKKHNLDHLAFKEPTQLFVNGVCANFRDVGKPVSAETPSRAFTKAVLAEGLIIRSSGFKLDPESGDKLLDSDGRPVTFLINLAAHTFHDLRHTFAVMFYKSEVLRGNSEPWEKLRQLLGHSIAETTRKIYLKYIDTEEAAISDITAHYARMGLYGVR